MQEFALSTETKFNLGEIPSKPIISRILRNSSALLTRPKKMIFKNTREKKGKTHAVDMALFDSMIYQNFKWVNINGDLIFLKARNIQYLADAKLPDNEKIHLKLSAGWLPTPKTHGTPIFAL